MDAPPANNGSRPGLAHCIVLGSATGDDVGKSMAAMHVAVGLLMAGQRVATVDVDTERTNLTRCLAQRRAWAEQSRLTLPQPTHHLVDAAGRLGDDKEAAECNAFAEAIDEAERSHDFVVIDTPCSETFLMRLAHMAADTLITTVGDGHANMDALAALDPQSSAMTRFGHYADLVREARAGRRALDRTTIDWVVLRSRRPGDDASAERPVKERLTVLSRRLGFRLVDGLSEHPSHRERYLRGLTILDDCDSAAMGTKTTTKTGARISLASQSLRHEGELLLQSLGLPC